MIPMKIASLWTLIIWTACLFLPGSGTAGTTLTIGVGRDFLDGPESRTYVHGSPHTWEALTRLEELIRSRFGEDE